MKDSGLVSKVYKNSFYSTFYISNSLSLLNCSLCNVELLIGCYGFSPSPPFLFFSYCSNCAARAL